MGTLLYIYHYCRRSSSTEHHPKRDDLIDPFWIEEKMLSRGEVDYLSGPEIQFWTDLIEKYLHPLDADSAKQVHRILKYGASMCNNNIDRTFLLFRPVSPPV